MSLAFGSNNSKANPFAIQSSRLGKIEKNYQAEDWMETIASNKGAGSLASNFSLSRISKISGFLLFLIIGIVGRSAWLQLKNGDYYYGLAQGNRIRIERIEAKRGIIYSSELEPLVANVANFLLYFIPAKLPQDKESRDKILAEISKIVDNLNLEDLKNILSPIKPGSLEAYQPIFVAENIPYEQALNLYLKSGNWPGVIISNKTKRNYSLNFSNRDNENNLPLYSLSHILGYTGKINSDELVKSGDEYLPIDYIGKVGIEYFWESELKGQGGEKQIEVDAIGKKKKIISEQEAQDGHNLVLSLDLGLQKKIEQVLSEHLEKLKLNKAVVIALNPNNGEILAMVSLPAYDNNAFARGISQEEYQALLSDASRPLFNRAIGGEYPTGSTIKPIMVAAALQEGVITEKTTFLSAGGIRIGSWFFPDWKAGGHGRVDARRAIAESVNTFFYYIGGGYQDFEGLGVNRITQYARLFGIGDQTGIDLPGESSGFLPSKEWKEEVKGERWYVGDTYHLSIGQGDVLATPLQVAVYTSVFANGGKLYRPHLVKEILDSNNQKIESIDTYPVRQNFIDNYNINIVRQGMRQAVTGGSARFLANLPVEAAGKTGTAQWSSQGEAHAWFIGFAPYDNPKIAITVLVEEGSEGSSVAVPIAKEILSWYFKK